MPHESTMADEYDPRNELRSRQHECKHIVVLVPVGGDCNDLQGYDGSLDYDGLGDSSYDSLDAYWDYTGLY
eukprot:4532191-Pyramimonas_sp.AAC.1